MAERKVRQSAQEWKGIDVAREVNDFSNTAMQKYKDKNHPLEISK